jgi:hypothetical protein
MRLYYYSLGHISFISNPAFFLLIPVIGRCPKSKIGVTMSRGCPKYPDPPGDAETKAVERRLLLLAEELGPILTLICKLRVAPRIRRVLVHVAKDLMLDGLIGENW